jgi:hypothetical protein
MPTFRLSATNESVSRRTSVNLNQPHVTRKVKILVGGTQIGKQITWAYPEGGPEGGNLGDYLVPVYQCDVIGVDDSGVKNRKSFKVLRFGVHCTDSRTAAVVGLADYQTYVIKRWIPTYSPHSAQSTEAGAWQVYKNYLIHDGPDDETEKFATAGCIEIMGPRGFIRFNDLIISLSGPKAKSRKDQLHEIAKHGNLSITYESAVRPPLEKAP